MNEKQPQGGGGVPVTCGVDQVPTVTVNYVKLILRVHVLNLISPETNEIANVVALFCRSCIVLCFACFYFSLKFFGRLYFFCV